MKKKNGRAKPSQIAPVFQTVLIGVVTYILLVALLLLGIAPEQHDISVGSPANMDIMATKDVNDTVTTERRREEAAAQVEPSYRSVDTSVLAEVMRDLDEKLSALADLRAEVSVDDAIAASDEAIAALGESLGISLGREQYVAFVDADDNTLRALYEDVSKLVRDLLSNTLLEGQESAAIATMSRTLSQSGYTAPLVSLAAEVMRACVRPNMLIDEETTEANRQKARDAVETVTCIKGEVIVRRGEIVTEAQYQMLSSLGLLKEDSVDIPLFAGIALIVLLIMGCLALYLYHYRRGLFKPKPLSLLCLIYVLVVALSLAISRWNNYLMPAALGMLLISLLIDTRVALYFNFALGLTVSLLADTSGSVFTVPMFSVVLMSLCSGPVIMAVFSRSMQRTTTLLVGVLVGLSNFVSTLAVGLINSAELSSVLTNALWALASGLLSAVLCIGFQPLMEWIFNIATNAKLIELSNPNQPMLRRLLLEAPGTYHHSIIVANLAEAAATAIGGNGLLARVGAYYHDIGKLKRPIYFKENQMGDNPHDRTDPRVSAAILTAHPRDGAAMAQKARVPEKIIDIIRQHHGDSVALWFYDKAIRQYGADQVDISAFRYDGPRPHSKEAAAVMLADSIEAAVRSLPDPDPEKVDALIRKLVRVKLDDGQLDESELTFGDLEKICSAFSTVLTGVFHERIEYPDISLPPREEKPDEAGTQPNEASRRGHSGGIHAGHRVAPHAHHAMGSKPAMASRPTHEPANGEDGSPAAAPAPAKAAHEGDAQQTPAPAKTAHEGDAQQAPAPVKAAREDNATQATVPAPAKAAQEGDAQQAPAPAKAAHEGNAQQAPAPAKAAHEGNAVNAVKSAPVTSPEASAATAPPEAGLAGTVPVPPAKEAPKDAD